MESTRASASHPQGHQQLSPATSLHDQHAVIDHSQSEHASLSSIAAFNAACDGDSPNQWGKRQVPSNDNGNTDRPGDAKRQHIEQQHFSDLHAQVAAAIAAGVTDAGVAAMVAHDTGSHYRTTQRSLSNENGAVAEETDGGGEQYHQSHHNPETSANGGVAEEVGEQYHQNNDNGVVDDDDPPDQDYELDEDEGEPHSNEGIGWRNTLSLMDPNSYLLWDANQNLRIQSLPILDNLSTQILTTLGKGPYQETLNIVTQPDSDQGQAYGTMKALFDQTKKLYTHEAFLSADELKLDTLEQRSTVRKVNLATFVSSVFGSQEVGFFHLNEHFLDTFVPDGGRLLKSQGALYLDLKTQAYISAMSTNERGKEEILTDLFPDDMKDILLARRPGAKQLTPSEQDFVARLTQRRAHLTMIPSDTNLSEKYVWQDFLKEVSWYVSKNYDSIVSQPTRRTRKRRSPGAQQVVTVPQYQMPQSHNNSTVVNHHSQLPLPQQLHQPRRDSVDAATTAAVLAAHHSVHTQNQMSQAQAQEEEEPLSNPAQMALEAELFGSNTSIGLSLGAPPLAQPPVPTQSAPTQVLYERARLAATAKSSPNARRAGLPSQRRPWTSDEENALMAGLDRVKGPHWSQILAMFGPGGTVNETLKDRNQVQLKDKARNLKLFFLKSGIEVPYYLQFVTGDLKKRAPGQALKNAAKKAVEESADEDAAHVAAVTALGNVQRFGSQELDMSEHLEEENMQNGAPTADMGVFSYGRMEDRGEQTKSDEGTGGCFGGEGEGGGMNFAHEQGQTGLAPVQPHGEQSHMATGLDQNQMHAQMMAALQQSQMDPDVNQQQQQSQMPVGSEEQQRVVDPVLRAHEISVGEKARQ